MATGGSIESIAVRGRLFPVAADADAGIKLGGFENEVQANGDGSARQVKTRIPWSLDGVSLAVDHTKDDLAFLQEVANDQDNVTIAVTLASGDVFHGRGTITGEVKLQTQNTTAALGFMGPGKLTKQ